MAKAKDFKFRGWPREVLPLDDKMSSQWAWSGPRDIFCNFTPPKYLWYDWNRQSLCDCRLLQVLAFEQCKGTTPGNIYIQDEPPNMQKVLR